MKPVESGLLVKAAGDEAPSEERDSTLTTEKEEPAEPASARDLLQLDASLKRVKWTVHYVEASNSLPVTAKHLVRTLTVELAVQEIMLLLDLAADVSVKGDAWVTDFTAKELPNNRAYNSLGKEDSYIVHQELYYRKTKPPKLGGGTMDTRRVSREDNVLKISFEYSKEGINGIFENYVQFRVKGHRYGVTVVVQLQPKSTPVLREGSDHRLGSNLSTCVLGTD